ncbi:hypothetical protein AVEN_127381-1 [Araneus ventricosus]|uniref:Uncharacterized protein n=1 Tax=Araneus ventricosus TaxID=182803 RepID=A0A4Y2ES21_ARAVE|nr:hypothetical protein AVEN_127381-1 [Araneus ventricosus]
MCFPLPASHVPRKFRHEDQKGDAQFSLRRQRMPTHGLTETGRQYTQWANVFPDRTYSGSLPASHVPRKFRHEDQEGDAQFSLRRRRMPTHGLTGKGKKVNPHRYSNTFLRPK